jgi:hypothetical protein
LPNPDANQSFIITQPTLIFLMIRLSTSASGACNTIFLIINKETGCEFDKSPNTPLLTPISGETHAGKRGGEVLVYYACVY